MASGDNATGLGGQPLVQPGGTVIVPFLGLAGTISSFTSTDGGASWGSSVTIASQSDHQVASLRTEALPSAEMDGSGKAYVAWQDCSFESGCSANDMVMSTSTDGTTWSALQLIPADAVGSSLAWQSIRLPPGVRPISRWLSTTTRMPTAPPQPAS